MITKTLNNGYVMLIPEEGEYIIREGMKHLCGKIILHDSKNLDKWRVATADEAKKYGRKEANNG